MVYGDQTEKTFGQFGRKRSDPDPFDRDLRSFRYRVVSSRTSVDTAEGRLWIEKDQALLYGAGQDNFDDHAAQHTDDGSDGDVVLWPPIKAIARAQGLMK